MGSRNGGIQNFVAKRLGSLWVVQQYLKRLGVQETVDSACPVEGQAKLTHGQVLSVLVGNRLNSPAPLYQVGEWAKTYAAEEVFGTPATLLNDDRIGRALDAIYPHLETLKGSDRVAGDHGVRYRHCRLALGLHQPVVPRRL